MAKRQQLDLYDVAVCFVGDPRKCVEDQAAREVIREYDLDWNRLVDDLWRLLNPGRDPKDEPPAEAEQLADFLAGYTLVRDMESQVKGVQDGGLRSVDKPDGHGPVSLGRAFRGKLDILDPCGKKVGATSIEGLIGKPDFTPAVTARLKTLLLAEMSAALQKQGYQPWWIREFLPKAWGLVGESFKPETTSRTLRRFRRSQKHA